jgi:acyl-coenzyme A thioesterase PaaI-like protein
LLGEPVSLRDDVEAVVELETVEEMAVDERGLVHGGFTFGLADYSAMLVVNDPFVVLGKSESRFLAPVKVGDIMRARAEVTGREGRRRDVDVEVMVRGVSVFKGVFTCYILDKHVLER